ncbi:hypothetical protein [Bacteroides sp. AM30-16]|uniref:hypothetical protein n=1 Tax=Bacteroides TaxID=816 RepID=UPI000E743165|nr:hypothetical protein [Bacteroides sp. AM30-16]
MRRHQLITQFGNLSKKLVYMGLAHIMSLQALCTSLVLTGLDGTELGQNQLIHPVFIQQLLV